MDEISTVGHVEVITAPHVSEWRRFRRVFFQRKLVFAGSLVLVLLVLVAIFAPLIANHDPYLNNLSESLQDPSSNHLLGTDKLGRDTFSRLVYGARTALYVGFGTVAVSAIVGMILGLLAGYLGGLVNGIIMRIMDALMGFPMLILALLLAAVLGGGLQNVIIALGVATLPGYTRLMCSETLSVKENEYIMAQRAIGSRSLRTMVRHVLPNAFQPSLGAHHNDVGQRDPGRGGPQLHRDRHQGAGCRLGQHGRRWLPHAWGSPPAFVRAFVSHRGGGIRLQHGGRRSARRSRPETTG